MTVFNFNVGSKSVERAVADVIGREIAARRPQDDTMPSRWLDILSQLDEKDGAAVDKQRVK